MHRISRHEEFSEWHDKTWSSLPVQGSIDEFWRQSSLCDLTCFRHVFVIFHPFITLVHLTLSRPSCQGRSRDHLSNLMCEEAIGTSAIAYFAASCHLWKYFQCCKVTYLQGEPLTSMFIYPRITTMKPALMQIRRFKDSEMCPAGPLAPPNMSIPLRSLKWYQGPLRSLRSTQTSELSISRVGPASCSQSFQRNS